MTALITAVAGAGPSPDAGSLAGLDRVPASAPADTVTRRDALRRWARAWYPGRSGDVMLVPRRGDMITGSVPFMHGSPWGYDARIPMLLLGPDHVRPGRRTTRAAHRDLGATLAALLGLPPAPGADGRVLEEALAASDGPPRVVALLVLDGLWAGHLDEMADSLPTLSRIRREGASFERAEVDVLPTATAPTHAGLSTGASPSRHGVVGNGLFDRRSGRPANVFEGADPANLAALALADRWSEATGGEAVIYAQGGTDYPATVLAGHGACRPGGHEVWMAHYSTRHGAWTTNDACYELPPILRGATVRTAWEAAGGAWLGHDVVGPSAVRRSAVFARFEGEAATGVLASLPFGRDTVADLLLVNLKAGDYTGHAHGPGSPEMAATAAELDRQVGRILRALDEAAGEGGWVLAVTADHGMPPEPEPPRARRRYGEVRRTLRDALDPEGPGVVEHLSGADAQIYLDRKRMDELGLDAGDAARVLEGLEWIFAAFPADEVRTEAARLRGAGRGPGALRPAGQLGEARP